MLNFSVVCCCGQSTEILVSRDDGNGNENIALKYKFAFILVLLCDYSNSFHLYNVAELSSNRRGGNGAFKLIQGIKYLPLCAHGLHKTLNLVISRCCLAEDGEEKFENL